MASQWSKTWIAVNIRNINFVSANVWKFWAEIGVFRFGSSEVSYYLFLNYFLASVIFGTETPKYAGLKRVTALFIHSKRRLTRNEIEKAQKFRQVFERNFFQAAFIEKSVTLITSVIQWHSNHVIFDGWVRYRRQISMISVTVNYIWTGIVFCVLNRNIVRFVGLTPSLMADTAYV